MPDVTIRPLGIDERADWEPLWEGYQAFYKVVIPAETTAVTWARLHDPAEWMHALGAYVEGRLRGIVHYLFHRSTSLIAPVCYLQDLFTKDGLRGKGVGRALIEAVYEQAKKAGAARVYWLTHETNTTAMALYDNIATKSGFLQYRKELG